LKVTEQKIEQAIWKSCYNGILAKTIHKTGDAHMVKRQKKNNKKKCSSKGFRANRYNVAYAVKAKILNSNSLGI